jgi:hypothetical protein
LEAWKQLPLNFHMARSQYAVLREPHEEPGAYKSADATNATKVRVPSSTRGVSIGSRPQAYDLKRRASVTRQSSEASGETHPALIRRRWPVLRGSCVAVRECGPCYTRRSSVPARRGGASPAGRDRGLEGFIVGTNVIRCVKSVRHQTCFSRHISDISPQSSETECGTSVHV